MRKTAAMIFDLHPSNRAKMIYFDTKKKYTLATLRAAVRLFEARNMKKSDFKNDDEVLHKICALAVGIHHQENDIEEMSIRTIDGDLVCRASFERPSGMQQRIDSAQEFTRELENQYGS